MNTEITLQPLLQDKEIKFDVPNIPQRLRNGEKLLSTIDHIEDSKGNAGDSGRLLATNLRLIWHSLVHKKFNLAIGYGCIINLDTRMINNKYSINKRLALYVLAGIGNRKQFEFLFTDISSESERLKTPFFQCVFDIYHLYQRTYLYRDLKLRAAILQNGELSMLPRERILNRVDGVWNLSSDQGNLGIFLITNIRVIWYADVNHTFNITLPYIQIQHISIRESKYGMALVIQTAVETGGNYTLGFRIDPIERLQQIYQEFISLHQIYIQEPDFGVIYINNQPSQQLKNFNTKLRGGNDAADMTADATAANDDIEEIDERQEKEINSKLNKYLAEGITINSNNNNSNSGANMPREPIYCKELGFALERIRDGYKLKDLWDVLPQQLLIVEED